MFGKEKGRRGELGDRIWRFCRCLMECSRERKEHEFVDVDVRLCTSLYERNMRTCIPRS